MIVDVLQRDFALSFGGVLGDLGVAYRLKIAYLPLGGARGGYGRTTWPFRLHLTPSLERKSPQPVDCYCQPPASSMLT